MAATYSPIATQTLGSAAASITFSSIPQTYTDLVLIVNGTNTTSNRNMYYRFNGDTGNNYSNTALYGDGSVAGSGRQTNTSQGLLLIFSNVQSTNIVNIMNYTNTTTYKTAIGRGNGDLLVDARVCLWRGSTGSAAQAINSITMAIDNGSNINAGTTATLYGILSA